MGFLFDDGVAYRFVTSLPGEVEVLGEECRLDCPPEARRGSPSERFHSMYEEPYTRGDVWVCPPGQDELPAVLVARDAGARLLLAGPMCRFTCMFVRSDGRAVSNRFSARAEGVRPRWRPQPEVLSKNPILPGRRGRALSVAPCRRGREDADLIENELVWLLAAPLPIPTGSG